MQERLLDAMESLLLHQDPAEITVEDIVQRAHASIGAFYKRFRSKHDLMPLLLSRLQSKAHRALIEALQDPGRTDHRLNQRIDALIDMFAAAQLQRRRIIRACVAGRLTATLQTSENDIAEARAMMDAMRNWLLACRSEMHHENPELAVRLGLYFALHSLQSALLFESLPPDISTETIKAEAKTLLTRYLSAASACS